MSAGTSSEPVNGIRMLCRAELLSPREERGLFRRLKRLRTRTGSARRVNALGARCRRGGRTPLSREAVAIRNRIVESNLRLVVSVARRFRRPERPLEDLVSEAAVPLIRCVESFDERRNTRFSTYATHALVNFFAKESKRLLRNAARAGSSAELDYATSVDGRHAPLNRMIRDEELMRLRDRLARLPRRERALIAARFGLTDDQRPRSFREIGVMHGLSKERARVITHEALDRLMQSFRECRAP
jgi:RNA polymerase sigma factor (sigma-70 family)